jgi:predicted phage tail protein
MENGYNIKDLGFELLRDSSLQGTACPAKAGKQSFANLITSAAVPFRVRVSKGLIIVLLFITPLVSVAQLSITGLVSDASSKNPMAFATVALTNTYITTVTNSAGDFEFKNLKAGDYVLSVSYLGYEIQEQKISLDKSINLNIQLQRKSILQEELRKQISDKTFHIFYNYNLLPLRLLMPVPVWVIPVCVSAEAMPHVLMLL